MKKFFLLLLAMMALCSTTATADVVFDETNFPDPNFRNAIRYAFEDEMISISYGQVLTDEMLSTTMMFFADGYNINSLKGIEYLTGIFHANFDMNNIDSADFSNNQLLRHLSLRRNPIRSVNIASCPLLENFYIGTASNEEESGYAPCTLEDLDLSHNPNLKQLHISCPNLKNLTLPPSDNNVLEFINISDFETQHFDLSNMKFLKEFYSTYSHISKISFYEPNPSNLSDIDLGLRRISIAYDSDLSFLDVSNQPLLEQLLLTSLPNIKTLNLSGCSSINWLSVDQTNLSAIDLSDLYNLNMCYVSGGRQVQVYSTDVEGVKQYYIPIATTDAHKGIKDLIEQENNYEDEDTGFDWADVVTESITGATLGEFDGESVLWLDATTSGASEGLHRMTYQYLTHCPNENYATAVFYLDWAEATTLRGDVNGDDEVDINDVTLLIDVVLGKNVEYNATAADCNTESGDGTIDINDVTALIDHVLNGNW